MIIGWVWWTNSVCAVKADRLYIPALRLSQSSVSRLPFICTIVAAATNISHVICGVRLISSSNSVPPDQAFDCKQTKRAPHNVYTYKTEPTQSIWHFVCLSSIHYEMLARATWKPVRALWMRDFRSHFSIRYVCARCCWSRHSSVREKAPHFEDRSRIYFAVFFNWMRTQCLSRLPESDEINCKQRLAFSETYHLNLKKTHTNFSLVAQYLKIRYKLYNRSVCLPLQMYAYK